MASRFSLHLYEVPHNTAHEYEEHEAEYGKAEESTQEHGYTYDHAESEYGSDLGIDGPAHDGTYIGHGFHMGSNVAKPKVELELPGPRTPLLLPIPPPSVQRATSGFETTHARGDAQSGYAPYNQLDGATFSPDLGWEKAFAEAETDYISLQARHISQASELDWEANSHLSEESDSGVSLYCDVQDCDALAFRGRYKRGNRHRHMRLKHGFNEKTYACGKEGCSKVFKRHDALRKHQRKHMGD